MSFFINCLKPPGMTSHDVVGFMRKLLNTKKIGHAGTLDPAATGVLPIAVGKATKAIDYLNSNKTYRCEAVLGLTTTTQDLSGEVLIKRGCRGVTESQVLEQLRTFIGSSEQVPPMYSAVKVKGKKLYELARKGETAAVLPRKISIKDIKVIDIKRQDDFFVVMFDVWCGKGTYVRTICHDLGNMLGCGGAMSFLIRTQAGPFAINDALTLEKLSQVGSEVENFAVSINDALDWMPIIIVDNNQLGKLTNGVLVALNKDQFNYTGTEKNGDVIKVFSKENQFIGIGEFKGEHNGLLKMKKNLRGV